jgi:hypothetical protein
MMNLLILLSDNRYIKFAYESTRFSNADSVDKMEELENQYSNDYEPIDFLDEYYGYKYRGKVSIAFSTPVKYGLFFDLELSSFHTKDLYSKDEFIDITAKIRYNISK